MLSIFKKNNDSLANRFFGEPYEDFLESFFAESPTLHKIKFGSDLPRANVVENEKDYTVQIVVPGINKNDLKITVNNQIMTVEKEDKQEKEEKGKNYSYREFHHSSFKRSFKIPENVNFDEIKSNYQDGILNIIIPKPETKEIKESGKTIAIE